MAKKEKATEEVVTSNIDDVSDDIIKAINKEFGQRIAYNLASEDAPTVVKNWISTGSRQLDYIIRNASNGGFPEGRIIEISGLPSTGKSHLAFAAASYTQAQGGIVIYVDTENAVMIPKLKQLGINVAKRFVYVETNCTEEVFAVIESTIQKTTGLAKKVPILVVWDSVAQTSPKAELDGEYDQNTIGLQARVISKGIRKITGVIAQNRVTFLCLNQLREKVGVLHGDPFVTPGGHAIPYASSIRVRLGSANPIKDEKTEAVIGTHVTVTIKKNKCAPAHRKCEFDIIFGKGIVEHEPIFDKIRQDCADNGPVTVGNETALIEGTGGWKTLLVKDAKTDIINIEKKFHKTDFDEILRNPEYKKYCDAMFERAYTLSEDSISNDAPDENEVTTE